MRVNINELLEDRRAARTVPFSERFEPPADDVALLEPVEGILSLTSTGRTVSLTGRMRTAASLVCGACLRRFPQPLEFPVNEEFGRGSPPAARGRAAGSADAAAGLLRGEVALQADDFVVPVGPDGLIDLSEVVRQHLVLALPFAPRCREDCRGLCPSCGADLNARTCTCPKDDVDPRLQVLRQWPPAVRSRPVSRKGRESWG